MRKLFLGFVFATAMGSVAMAQSEQAAGGFGTGVGSSTSSGYVSSYGNGGAASTNQGFVDTTTGATFNGTGFSTTSSVQTGNENSVSSYGTGYGAAGGVSTGFTDTAAGFVGFNANCW